MPDRTNLSPIVTMVNIGCRSASLLIPKIKTRKERAIITGKPIPGSKRSLKVSPTGKTYMARADKAKRSRENNKSCTNIRTELFIPYNFYSLHADIAMMGSGYNHHFISSR